MATFEILERQGLKMIKATLNNETIRSEAGALHYLQGKVEMESAMPSAAGFLKSVVTKETIFRPTYKGTGEVFFGPPTLGEYTLLDLNKEAWVLDKGAFVCCDFGVEVGVFRNKAMTGLMGGEGFFQTKVEGTGRVAVVSQGPLQIVDLVNDQLVVDGNFAVARQAHLDFTVRRAAKSLLGSLTSGEGLVSVISGTGRVYIAPVPNVYLSVVEEVARRMIGFGSRK
jgi:uncharacterized protein (TIGR00266 family)